MFDLIWNEIIVKSFTTLYDVWTRIELSEGMSLFDWFITLILVFGVLSLLVRSFIGSSLITSAKSTAASVDSKPLRRRDKEK